MIILAATQGLETVLQKASDAYYNEGNVYKLVASDLPLIPAALRKEYGLKAG